MTAGHGTTGQGGADAQQQPMSHVDAAWRRMDSATNPMVITSVLLFEGGVPFAQVEQLLRERLLPHPRFTQRVVESHIPLAAPHWERDPHFDLRAHLHHVRLPAPADRAQLEELVGDLMSTPLDPDRPLWQAHVVDDAPGGKTALVVRLHHCIGDGVTLVKLLLSLCDDGQAPRPRAVGLKPGPHLHGALDLARAAAGQAATLGRLVLLPADADSPLKGPLSTRKHVAWSEGFSLEGVRTVAGAAGATVNDVLETAVTGALRDYLLEVDALPPQGRPVRAMVPVFLQGDERHGLGNHFGLVFLDLPVDIPDPQQRLREVKRRMDTIKQGDDATVAFAVLDAIGTASSELEHIALEVFTRKASLLTTNVPGPPSHATLGGRKLETMLVWAPVSGYIGLSLTMLSYAGEVRLGVSADAQRVASPRKLADAFTRQLEALAG